MHCPSQCNRITDTIIGQFPGNRLRLRGVLSQTVPVRDKGIRTGQKEMLDCGVETTELLAIILFEDGPLELS